MKYWRIFMTQRATCRESERASTVQVLIHQFEFERTKESRGSQQMGAMMRPSPPPPLPNLAGGLVHCAAPPRLRNSTGKLRRVLTIKATHSGLSDVSVVQSPPGDEASVTGAAYSFRGATTSLTNKKLTSSKKITLLRHGLSSWNAESRVQGSSNLSVLTETGVKQAEKCRDALANMNFDVCFSSPISRAKSTAEIIWQGKEEPLVFLDSLKEAHLFFLEGMTNGSGC